MNEGVKNRLREEIKDLEDKSNKLFDFMTNNPLYGKLNDLQVNTMSIQYHAMQTYLQCLITRMNDTGMFKL
jgi:hypothetical protein